MRRPIYILFLLLSVTTHTYSQGLIINGGNVIMKGGVYLVIDKNANDGITRPSASGGILNKDENENNYVSWVIKNGASNDYTVPWLSSNLSYAPFIYHVSAPGSNDGRLMFSTWQTLQDNASAANSGVSGMPNGVNNMHNPGGTDNSSYCADRFWWVKYLDYTTKPTATLTFSYNDPTELSGSVTEADLQAQYWNAQWINLPLGSDNPSDNFVSAVPAQSFDAPWVLVSNNSPLPIELLSFNAKIADSVVDLSWSTASEINSDFFTVERSANGADFRPILTKPAAGASNTTTNYSDVDPHPLTGLSYYRLKETDFNGIYQHSKVIPIYFNSVNEDLSQLSIYPNPSQNSINVAFDINSPSPVSIHIFDITGKLVYTEKLSNTRIGANSTKIDIRDYPPGLYFLQLITSENKIQNKFIKTE